MSPGGGGGRKVENQDVDTSRWKIHIAITFES
jgi:hypothetical protein